MSKPAVLLLGEITHSRKEWENCASFAELKEYPDSTREQFLKKCDSGEYRDVVAIYRSNWSHLVTGSFDAELVNRLPDSLKFICYDAAGYDDIDIAACTSRHIQVSNTPIVVDNATADVAIFLMLGALRRIHPLYTSIRASEWRGPSPAPGHDPRNKLLGILGMGGIGRQVAERARAFGMKIQYHNRSRLSPDLEKYAKYVSFEELIKTSDVLSLNLSLTKETVRIVGEKEFEMMKKGVVVINTARGQLIDEQALVNALKQGKVWSAGLDVYEAEPNVNEGLLKNPNVILLPHVGATTFETRVCPLYPPPKKTPKKT